MVVNDTLRNMGEASGDYRNTETLPTAIITQQDKFHSQISAKENIENIDKDNTKQSCNYKALSSPKLRQRKQKISMFEIQPDVVKEITEVQELCIETGSQQHVKESVTVLPELTSNLSISNQNESLTELLTSCPASTFSKDKSEAYTRQMTKIPITFRGSSQDLSQDLRKAVVGKGNKWMGLESKLDTPRIPPCSETPPTSPSIRRRSVGVLMTPAWALRTFRDPDTIENRSSSPALRRRSLVLPGRHVPTNENPNFLRRRSLVSPDVRELTKHKDYENNTPLSKSTEELTKPSKEQQLVVGNENKYSQDQSETNINNQVTEEQSNVGCDDELEDFRPRLRSRSLDDYRSQARENILQHRKRPELDQRKKPRRKSFEVWLGEKEQETAKKLQMLALERQRAADEKAKRKEQRKGKSYDEWLNDKNNMATVKCSSEKQDETTKQERHEIAKRRYDKWLMEKEMQVLEKEREMLELAKLKTIRTRKEHEEKRNNRLKILTRSLFS